MIGHLSVFTRDSTRTKTLIFRKTLTFSQTSCIFGKYGHQPPHYRVRPARNVVAKPGELGISWKLKLRHAIVWSVIRRHGSCRRQESISERIYICPLLWIRNVQSWSNLHCGGFCLLLSYTRTINTSCAHTDMASHSITKEDIEHGDLTTHVESLPKGAQVTEIDNFRVVGLTPDDAEFFTNYPESKRKSVFRKVDSRLVPMLAVLYLISHIDRANIGNAKIEGMVEDLGMSGVQYNTVLSICTCPPFFVGSSCQINPVY